MKGVVTITIASVIALTGCASSGIIPTDKDTYTISKTSAAGMFGTPEGVKNDIYVEANAFCAKQNKTVQTVNLRMNNAMAGVRQGSADLTFRCVNSGPRESAQCNKRLSDDPALSAIKGKVALTNSNDQTFDMLSNSAKPTPQEKEQLKIWGNKRDECMRMLRAEWEEDRVALPYVTVANSGYTSGQLLVVELMNGNLTYGSYAAKRQALSAFVSDTTSKIQAELQKQTQDSRFRAEQLAIEAKKNDLLRQKIVSDSANTTEMIRSYERVNTRPVTTNCNTLGGSVNCTTR